MKELLMLVRGIILHAFEIATLRSVGDRLPDSKWFASLSAALSVPFTVAEQLARGHGIVGALVVPAAWLLAVWGASMADGKIDYRAASALLLGSIPVCAVLVLVAGHGWLELAVAVWGSAVMVNVIVKRKKERSSWL
jgi:hypothetical protein